MYRTRPLKNFAAWRRVAQAGATIARCHLRVVWVSCVAMLGALAHEGPHPAKLDDADHVEMFMDGVVKTVMYQRQVPGAVLTIVKDGAVLVNKGYGVADIEKKTPVDPGRTLFRIASLSKTINATAVMQLVEQGKLDLNGEVNPLLERYRAGFSIPEHYPQKIRLLDLLNHTAGFDERAIGMARRRPNDVPPLGLYLAARMPAQVLPPRSTISYSNHGVALAGYLVQLVTAEPYGSYVRDHVFAPLGMTHSSMEWSAALAPDIAQGYQISNGLPGPVAFDYLCIPPAGGALSCGADMAQFMIAHLQNGRVGETRILQETTAIEMHRMQYEQDPRLDRGIAVAFFTGTKNGHRFLDHGGDLNGFASRIWLLPDDGIGIFTSCNIDDDALRGAIIGQFMERYFPAPESAAPNADASSLGEAKKYVGVYRSNRFGRLSVEKIMTLTEQTRVTADDHGNLHLAVGGAAPEKYFPAGSGVYVNARNGEKAVFRKDNSGAVTTMAFGGGALERLTWYEQSRWQLLFIAATVTIFASAVVCWPIAWAARKRRTAPARTVPAYYRLTSWCVAALALYLLVKLGVTLSSFDKWEFTYGMPGRIVLLLLLNPVLTLGSALLVLNTLAVWWRGYWSLGARVHYTLVTAASVSLTPFFVYWNLFGLNW